MREHDASGAERARITAELDKQAAQGVVETVRRERTQREALWDRFAKQIGPRYARCTLGTFRVSADAETAKRQRGVLEAVARYEAKMQDHVSAGRGLLLFGPSGTGKDHLVTALARVAIMRHGLWVRWVRGSAFCLESRDGMSAGSEQELVERYSRARILYLSDPLPPIGNLSAYQSSMLYEIIDARARASRPTWTTLNVKQRAEAEGRMGVSIVDRLQDNAVALRCEWPSFRAPHTGEE